MFGILRRNGKHSFIFDSIHLVYYKHAKKPNPTSKLNQLIPFILISSLWFADII